MTATEISHLLAQRAEDLCAYLLPNGEDRGGEWCVGSLSGEPGGSLKVPLRGPKLGMFRDFAGADTDKGDMIGLWKAVRNVDVNTACREALEWLNIPQEQRNGYRRPVAPKEPKAIDAHWTELQSRLRKGTIQELQALADQRKLGGTAGLEKASSIGQLFFTDVYDNNERHPAWILTDSARLNGQARKIDGTEWKFDGKRKPAKSKTVWSPEAGWPVGINDVGTNDIVLVEGNPDFIAAHQAIWMSGRPLAPVGIFGASTVICEEALSVFAGKTVYIMAHSEESGVGLKAAQRWERQIKAAGGNTILKTFSQDGVKDLNDLLSLAVNSDQEDLITGLWPAAMPVIEENWDEEGPSITVTEPKKETEDEKYERLIKETLYDNNLIIPKPVPIFTAAGTTICTPGNLTAYYSQAKAGKTAIIGGMLAATMELPGALNDTLGFKGSNALNKAVIHFDTEQSRYDWQQMLRTAMRRAKVDQPPSWLKSHILTGRTAGECRILADRVIARYAKEFGGVYAVFFDGVGDLVTDVNEPKECNELVAHLHGQAITHDCAIVNVLHMNAGNESEKGRGHLGSQLERKSESNITMEKVDGISSYWGIKQRGRAISKDSAPSFQWSDEAGMHVSCAATPAEKKPSKGGSAKKFHFATFATVFTPDPIKAITRSASYRFAKELADIKEPTWRDLLADAVRNGELLRITKSDGYYYHLPEI